MKVASNLVTVNFLDVVLSLNNGAYTTISKSKKTLVYINIKSDHLPPITKHIYKSTAHKSTDNFSYANIFNKIKMDYKTAGYLINWLKQK